MKKIKSVDGWVNPADKRMMKVYSDYWEHKDWIPTIVDVVGSGLLFVQRTLPITPDAFKAHNHG